MTLISESLIAPNFGGSNYPPMPISSSERTPKGETPQGSKQEKVTTDVSQLLSLVIDKILKVVVFIFGPVGQLRPSPSYDNEVIPYNNSAALYKLITSSKEEIIIHITPELMNSPGAHWDRFATNNKKNEAYVAHCGTIFTHNPTKTKKIVEAGFRNIPDTFKQDISFHTEILGNHVRYFLVVPEDKKNSYCTNLPSCHGV